MGNDETTKRRNDETTKRRNDETTKRRNDETTKRRLGLATIVLVVAALTSCTVPNPNKRYRDGGVDAQVGAPPDGPVVPQCTANQALRCDDTNLVRCNADGTGEVDEPCPFGCNPTDQACASKPGPVCTANQVLRCDGINLVRCNADGTGEAIPQPCSLGCNAAEKRCYDMEPSNGLAALLAQAGSQVDLNLGDSATINTDSGDVTVNGSSVRTRSEILPQSGAPAIRVLIVGSLTTNTVSVTGSNALAIVSNGDIKIDGTFDVSAKGVTPGPGAFNDAACVGKVTPVPPTQVYVAGKGGGGFGSPGGRGGSARCDYGSVGGPAGGGTTGNASLIPLRGGCSGGDWATSQKGGAGGGTVQLVSRTKISVDGIVAANGSSNISAGSGGGILLEAPTVQVAGRVVANGASGGPGIRRLTCGPGEDGHLDAKPAVPGGGCINLFDYWGAGGFGAAVNSEATDGQSIAVGPADSVFGGNGGGGVGRIRINAAPGGVGDSGVFSPTPTRGILTAR